MNDFITPTRLKSERKWTDSLIRDFLGDPDKIAKNPNYRSGPPMRLYSTARVLECEDRQDFQEAYGRALKRSESARVRMLALHQMQRDDLFSAIDDLTIEVVKIEDDDLLTESIRHYNNLWAERGKDKFADRSSPDDFLVRIQENYIRHALTKYDRILAALYGSTGKSEAYQRIRDRVNHAVQIAYPRLFNANSSAAIE